MPPKKPKPPTETKAQLMDECSRMLRVVPFDPIEYLLNYFTAVDLVGIRDELKEKRGG